MKKKKINKSVNVKKQLKIKLENTLTRHKNAVGFRPTEAQAYSWFRYLNKMLFNSRLTMVQIQVKNLNTDWGR